MAEKLYSVLFRPKKAAAAKHGALPLRYTTEANTAAAAAGRAKRKIELDGYDSTHYFAGKATRVTEEQAAELKADLEREIRSSDNPGQPGSQSTGQPAAAAAGADADLNFDDEPPLSDEPPKTETQAAIAPAGSVEGGVAEAKTIAQQKPAAAHANPEAANEMLIDEINAAIDELQPGERLRLEGIPATVYHKTKGYGSSSIKLLLDECPAMLRASLDGLLPRDDSKYVLGSATHDRLLLPDVFEHDYVIQPKTVVVDGEETPLKVRNGKAWETCKALFPGKVIITEDQHQAAEGMRKAFLDNHGDFFTGGVAEVSYWYRHPDHNIILKARTDYEQDDLGIDAKTTASANPRDVDRQFYNLKYYIQEKHYLIVTGLNAYVFNFVATKYPHFTLGPRNSTAAMARLGELQVNQAYQQLSYCETYNHWPDFEDGYQEVKLPYQGRKLLEELEGNK